MSLLWKQLSNVTLAWEMRWRLRCPWVKFRSVLGVKRAYGTIQEHYSTWNPGIRALSSGRSFRLRSPTPAVCTQATSYYLLRYQAITGIHMRRPDIDPLFSSGSYRTEHSSSCGSHYHRFSNPISLPKDVGQQPMSTQPLQLKDNSSQQILSE